LPGTTHHTTSSVRQRTALFLQTHIDQFIQGFLKSDLIKSGPGRKKKIVDDVNPTREQVIQHAKSDKAWANGAHISCFEMAFNVRVRVWKIVKKERHLVEFARSRLDHQPAVDGLVPTIHVLLHGEVHYELLLPHELSPVRSLISYVQYH